MPRIVALLPRALAKVVAPAALLAIGAGLSCRQLAGISAKASVQQRCSACASNRCANDVVSCDHDATCSSRRACDVKCEFDEPACHAQCVNSVSAGAYEVLAGIEACVATQCQVDCATTCGGVPLLMPSDVADACDACTNANCCDVDAACAANPDCWRIAECLRARPSFDGTLACTDVKYAAGTADYRSFFDCARKNCSRECAIGTYLSCLDGHTNFPVPTEDTIKIPIRAIGAIAQDNTGVPNLDALLCTYADPDCTAPVAAGSTDATGLVILSFDTRVSGGAPTRSPFTGFLRLAAPSRDRPPTYVYSPPISETSGVRVVLAPRQSTGDDFARLANITLDPTRGLIFLAAYDCVGRFAPQVKFVLSGVDASTRLVYTRGLLPSSDAVDTDDRGAAVVFNAPAGAVSVSAWAKGRDVPIARADVLVRAASFTIVVLAPQVL